MRPTKTHPRSLIRFFIVRMKKCFINYPNCAQWRLWSDCADAQYDQSLCWAHVSEVQYSFLTSWLTYFIFTGAIPGPIMLGIGIDATCVVWGKGCQEGVTSCWIYDNEMLGRNVCIFSTAVNFGAAVMLTIAYLFYMASIRKKENSYTISDTKNSKETSEHY